MRNSEERLILICEECGEKLVLMGSKDDWRSRRAIFKCECGRKITLDDRVDEGALAAV